MFSSRSRDDKPRPVNQSGPSSFKPQKEDQVYPVSPQQRQFLPDARHVPAYVAPYRIRRMGRSYGVINFITGRAVAVGLGRQSADERVRILNREAREQARYGERS